MDFSKIFLKDAAVRGSTKSVIACISRHLLAKKSY